jgi:FKBP-type peptidyl-prolyl cis-trans isomerase
LKKLSLLCIPIVLALATACGAGASDEAGETDMSPTAKTSYAIGWQTGRSFVQQELEVDADSVVQGFRDALAQVEPKWPEEELVAALQQLQQDLMQRQQQRMQEESAGNEAAGKAFLETNGARDGVTTTASGLQYEVLTEGDGLRPKATDTVTVHYRGTLLDGTEFDSSYARGTPATFRLDKVIGGWTEGLQLMTVGSKYKLYIPSQLAYGSHGAPPKIGPGATLVFEVELLDIAQ